MPAHTVAGIRVRARAGERTFNIDLSALINADERGFGEEMLACLALDVPAGWLLADRKAVDRKG